MTNFRDDRDDLPVFIHSELDDLDLSCEAFRVYCHLVRRVGRNEAAFPSYQSIGERCFAKDYPKSKATRRRHAINAVKELAECGLIHVQKRRNSKSESQSNLYRLMPRKSWKGSAGSALGSDAVALGSVMDALGSAGSAPKGTPLQDIPLEGTPQKGTPLLNQYLELTKDGECSREEEFTNFKEESLTKEKEKRNTSQQSKPILDESTAKDSGIKNPNPQPPSPRQSPIAALIKDDDGWLIAPTQGKYKLAGVITLRRLQYAIALEFIDSSYEMTFFEDGGLEIDFKGESLTWEEFEEDHPIGKLRKIAASGYLDGGWWNETLQEFFLEAVDFCKKWGDRALEVSRSNPAILLFDDLED